MLPSNPVPQVVNYGSSAVYKDLPTPEQIASGVIPLDSLPAAWWNAMWACTNQAVNCARYAVGVFVDEINTVLTQAGVCVCDTCVDQLYQAIEKIRTTIGDASVAGAVKSSSCPGEVSIDANGIMTANCLGNAASLTTIARTVVGAVNELKSTYDCCFTDATTALDGKAPTSHVSSATTCGVGNAGCYGHLKISDTYTGVLAACTGVAASQKAVACVYSVADGKAAVGSTVGCALGTASAGTATTAARSDHVHPLPSCVLDSTNASCKITFNYGAAGVTNPIWIAGWNGYELRAVCRATLCVAYATCTTNAYHDTYTGNSDRPIMVTSDNDYSAAGYYAQGTVRSGCNFTYNPATGMLKLKSSGKTACISHQNASYLHIYTDAACIAFNQDVYLPSGKYIDRAKYACCASYNGSGTAFGTAATCAATAFRSCTWYPNNISCGCVCCASCATSSCYTLKVGLCLKSCYIGRCNITSTCFLKCYDTYACIISSVGASSLVLLVGATSISCQGIIDYSLNGQWPRVRVLCTTGWTLMGRQCLCTSCSANCNCCTTGAAYTIGIS